MSPDAEHQKDWSKQVYEKLIRDPICNFVVSQSNVLTASKTSFSPKGLIYLPAKT